MMPSTGDPGSMFGMQVPVIRGKTFIPAAADALRRDRGHPARASPGVGSEIGPTFTATVHVP